jgi:uncharacterized damage-inducible protein DinB
MQMDAKFFAGQFDYHRWATQRVLKTCEPLGREEMTRHLYTSYGSLFGTLVHMYRVDGVWLRRLRGHATAPAPDAPPDFRELRAAWAPVLDGLYSFAADLTDDRIDADLPFRSTVVGDAVLRVWQVLLHVVNHGSYHRGQIITMLRQLGHEAVSTDMSFYYMEKQRFGVTEPRA